MEEATPARTRRDREGALAWLAILAVAVVGVAAVISGTIRHSLAPPAPAANTSGAADRPSPAPPPLPRPGAAPAGKAL